MEAIGLGTPFVTLAIVLLKLKEGNMKQKFIVRIESEAPDLVETNHEILGCSFCSALVQAVEHHRQFMRDRKMLKQRGKTMKLEITEA